MTQQTCAQQIQSRLGLWEKFSTLINGCPPKRPVKLLSYDPYVDVGCWMFAWCRQWIRESR